MDAKHAPPDPIREDLRAIRRALLRLHKALVDFARADHERAHGALGAGALLQLLVEDERFAWLRPYSELIVQMDEALARRDEPLRAGEVDAFAEEVFVLAGPPGSRAGAALERFHDARQRSAAVQMAHGELLRQLARHEPGG